MQSCFFFNFRSIARFLADAWLSLAEPARGYFLIWIKAERPLPSGSANCTTGCRESDPLPAASAGRHGSEVIGQVAHAARLTQVRRLPPSFSARGRGILRAPRQPRPWRYPLIPRLRDLELLCWGSGTPSWKVRRDHVAMSGYQAS